VAELFIVYIVHIKITKQKFSSPQKRTLHVTDQNTTISRDTTSQTANSAVWLESCRVDVKVELVSIKVWYTSPYPAVD